MFHEYFDEDNEDLSDAEIERMRAERASLNAELQEERDFMERIRTGKSVLVQPDPNDEIPF